MYMSAHSPSVIAGCIGESRALGSARRIRKDINLVESLYNDNKALLDQHNLDIDLKELAGYVRSCALLAHESDNIQNYTRPRQLAQLDQSGPGQEETSKP